MSVERGSLALPSAGRRHPVHRLRGRRRHHRAGAAADLAVLRRDGRDLDAGDLSAADLAVAAASARTAIASFAAVLRCSRPFSRCALQRFQVFDPRPLPPQGLRLHLDRTPKPLAAFISVVARARSRPAAPFVGAETGTIPDRFAPTPAEARPGMQQRPLPDAGQFDGEVSFDHLIGAGEECFGNCEPERPDEPLRDAPISKAHPAERNYCASCGPLLRQKAIDVSRRLGKSALSFQVRAGRGDSIALGIENRDVITVVARVVEDKFVAAMAMCAGCH